MSKTSDPPATLPADELDEGLAELLEEFEELEETVDDPEEVERVRRAKRVALAVSRPRVFGNVITGFDRADATEALLGSVLLGIPMLVESGTQEIGTFLASRPLYYGTTVVFGVALVVGIIYVADIQDVRVSHPILGFVPRRLVGVLAIAAVTAAGLMTAWGRVDWADPWVALAQVTVAAVPMAIGGALGDILPGS